MFARGFDFDAGLGLMDELRRRVDTMMDELDAGRGRTAAAGVMDRWPAMAFVDEGNALMVRADVPGLAEKDVTVSLDQDVLTVRGERRVELPAGYSVHRQERPAVKFARSLALPCKVDVEKVTAVVKDGVLNVHLPKAPESRPRQISVRGA